MAVSVNNDYAGNGRVLANVSFNPSGGLGGQRVVRPEMFRIAALQLFFHLRVAALPKAGEIGGDLDGAAGRREQVEEEGYPAAADGRRLRPAEHLLDAHREERRSLDPVFDPDF
jgi:hypothetical protein